MFRQNRELPHDLRQFAIAGRVEREGDLSLSRRLGFDDVTIISGELRIVVLERREKITSSGVTGCPSCHFASARKRYVTEEKSAGCVSASARSPYCADASSSDGVSNVS
jgi:hypothetical protein